MREAASFIARQHGAVETGLLAIVADTVGRAARAWSNRRTIVSLGDFDDHMLADIGISRDDVRQALAVPFGEDPALMLQHLALRNRKRGWSA